MEHPWFCLLLLLCSTSATLAQTVCKLSYNGVEVSKDQWDIELMLTPMVGQLEDSRQVGQVVIEFDAADIDQFNEDSQVEFVYIKPTLSPDKKKFTLTVGPDFPNYEENLKDQINIAKKQLQGSYRFQCTGGSIAVLNTLIDLKDTNNHPPFFVNGAEELTLPMPIPAGVAISRLFDKPVTIEDIDFSTKDLILTLDETSTPYFSVQPIKVNDVTWTAEIVTIQQLQFEGQFTITVTAKDVSDETVSQSSQQSFTINIDTGHSIKLPPEFTSPLYQQVIKDVSVPLDLQVKLKEPDSVSLVPECKVDADNGGGQVCDLLQIGPVTTDGSIPITWISADVDLTNFKYILLTLSATSESGTGYTVIHIGLPELTEPPATTGTPCEPCTTTEYTTIACEPCTTTVMECPTTVIETTTPCEPCATTAAFECPTTVIETTTPCEPCATTAPLECPTTLVPTTTECPVCTTTECPMCTTTEVDCPTKTTTACEPCTTTVLDCTTPSIEPCECTTNTPEPGTTSNPEPGTTNHCEPCEPCDCGSTTTSIPGSGPNINFDKDKYVITIDPNQFGDLFEPIIEGSEGYDIKFSLLIDNEYLNARIAIDENTGIVTLLTNLFPGSYAFSLKAEAIGTSSTATALALIGVTSTCNCGSGTNVFSYALLVYSATEEQSVMIPGDLNNDTCAVAFVCNPPTASEFVTVNASGDLYLNNLDREVMASFVIDMYINCNDSAGTKYLASEPGYDTSIAWDPDTMRVAVTVEDINDSQPKFNADQFTFGYPKRNLLSRTMPSSVGTLIATDDDEGDNAKIKYITESDQFTIHPETGAIYVRHDVLDYDEETFVVTALDSPTVGNSQTATATVVVKMLDESHIFVTTVEDATNEDLGNILLYLSSSTGYSVHALSVTAAFEGVENSTVNSKNLNNAAISIITYAFNDGNPVTMNEFESSLPQTDSQYKVSAISALPAAYEKSSGPIDNTGFIAAVSVLGALLGLIILGFACIYIFVIRPKLRSNSSGYKNQNGNPYDQPKSVTNERTEEDEPHNTGGYNAWTTYNTASQLKNNGINENTKEDRKPSVTIWKQEFDENTGKIRKPESSDHVEEDEENDYERRKSLVTFNENVECIEVDRL